MLSADVLMRIELPAEGFAVRNFLEMIFKRFRRIIIADCDIRRKREEDLSSV